MEKLTKTESKLLTSIKSTVGNYYRTRVAENARKYKLKNTKKACF